MLYTRQAEIVLDALTNRGLPVASIRHPARKESGVGYGKCKLRADGKSRPLGYGSASKSLTVDTCIRYGDIALFFARVGKICDVTA